MYIFAYALLAGFFLMERYVRQGKDTKNMSRTKSDKGSTTLISITIGILFIDKRSEIATVLARACSPTEPQMRRRFPS